ESDEVRVGWGGGGGSQTPALYGAGGANDPWSGCGGPAVGGGTGSAGDSPLSLGAWGLDSFCATVRNPGFVRIRHGLLVDEKRARRIQYRGPLSLSPTNSTLGWGA